MRYNRRRMHALGEAVRPRYSVVIPVYNSATIVGETIDRTLRVFEEHGHSCEVILVNDGSTDASWQVIRDKALTRPNVTAINLLKNYGQHAAILCGFQHSRGEWVVTMDDDLQNPPEEIVHLIERANRGHDVVCGRFRQKRHPVYRRLASKVIDRIDRHVFHKPRGLALTNFRIIRRDVIERILAYPTPYPYIRGLMLISSTNPTDVLVEHHPRPGGGTSYSFGGLLAFAIRIVFSSSILPVRAVMACGIALSVASVLAGLYLIVHAWLVPAAAASTTLSVLIGVGLLNGVTITAVAIVGEYVVALGRQGRPVYQVQQAVGAGRPAPALVHRAAIDN